MVVAMLCESHTSLDFHAVAVEWQHCRDYSALLQREAPAVICMGGGYSRPIEPTVEAHSDVYRMAALALAGNLCNFQATGLPS